VSRATISSCGLIRLSSIASARLSGTRTASCPQGQGEFGIRPPYPRGVVELFTVPPGEDAAFLAAWREARGDAPLHRALRDDAPHRYAHVPDAPDASGGVLLIAPHDVPLSVFETRQGFLGARLHEGGVAVVHWSSPLMYARTVRAHGDLVPGGALYARVR
jgi:hypothetical protein